MATKSQGTAVRVSTAEASAKTITGITAANPPVVSSTAHGYDNGDIVRISGVVGMIEVNDRAFVVSEKDTDSFKLKGVDGTAFTAYSSGGEAKKQTMTLVGKVRDGNGFDGEAPDIDVTHLLSTAKEKEVGLQDYGGVSLDLLIESDTGQTRLRALKASGAKAAFAITLSDGTVAAFLAAVKSFPFNLGGVDGVVTGTVNLAVATEPAWFA